MEQRRYTSGTYTKRIVYGYNNANQLITTDEFDPTNQIKATQYMYDELGNLSDKNIDNTPGNGFGPIYTDETWQYAYDSNNRLVDVNKNTTDDIADYIFNLMGNRVQKDIDGGDTINMLYDRRDCVADYDDQDELQRYYITPFMDENMLMNVAVSRTPTSDYYYAQDGLMTVRQIYDASSTPVRTYDYEGFGTSASTTGTLYNRFRYTGREIDEETYSANSESLYYYRARTYDTTIGSFTSRDPIPYANLYPYCVANPINYTDPNGLSSVTVGNYVNCKGCAKKYIECMLGKIQSAINKANTAVSDMLYYITSGWAGGNFSDWIDWIESHCTIDSPTMTAEEEAFYKKSSYMWNNYFQMQEYLSQSYSFFDHTYDSGTLYGSFNRHIDKHVKTLRIISGNIGSMLTYINNGMQTVECAKKEDMKNSVNTGGEALQITHDFPDGSSHIENQGIRLNMSFFCRNLDETPKYTLYSNSREKFNAHTIMHELTHLGFWANDHIWQEIGTSIGDNVRYKKIGFYDRKDHADTYARFLMNFYDDEPECKIDK